MAEGNEGGLANGEMTDSGLFDCMESEEVPPDQTQENDGIAEGQQGVQSPRDPNQVTESPSQRQVIDSTPENQDAQAVPENSSASNGPVSESLLKSNTQGAKEGSAEGVSDEQSELPNKGNSIPQENVSPEGASLTEKTVVGEGDKSTSAGITETQDGPVEVEMPPPPLAERMPGDGQEVPQNEVAATQIKDAEKSLDNAEQAKAEDKGMPNYLETRKSTSVDEDLKEDSVPRPQGSEDDRDQNETPEKKLTSQDEVASQPEENNNIRTQQETRTLQPSQDGEQESGRKSTHSSKSVKFLDESPSHEEGAEDEDEDRQVANFEKYVEEERQQGSDDDDTERTSEDGTESKSEGRSSDLFQTAVSEEKIEEAKQRRTSVIDKEAFVVDLFGRTEVEKETMGEVIEKKAQEHFDNALSLMQEQDFFKAIISLDKALNLKPRRTEYFIKRGECYLQICDFQSAILNYKKACVLDPENEDYYNRLAFIYFFQGQTLFDQHKFSDALESFSRAAEMKPEIVGYHTRSVACLAALQRHGECLALVNKRLEVEHENPDLYIMRARLHELFRNTTLCFYDLKDALQLNPEQAEALMMMGKLEDKANEYKAQAVRMNLAGKCKEALQKISMAIETNPTVAEYHVLRGALHRRLQDFNSAIDDYLLALDKTDHDEEHPTYQDSQRQLLLTYNDFAVECFTKGFFDEAIILLNKAIKGEKREKGLYVNRGDCFFKQDELQFALADYHQALELDQEDWTIRARIANIHNEFGLLDYDERSYQEAEARFTIAIKHNPRVAQYYVSRSKVRYMMENHGGARQDLLLALHVDPSNDELMSLLPRLFPGKGVGDVMRSKAARAAKLAIENAVVMASPVKLPSLPEGEGSSETQTKDSAEESEDKLTSKPLSLPGTAFSYKTTYKPGFPDLKACVDEMEFHKEILKGKKRITHKVKKMLHERNSLRYDGPKLAPQPPARPVAVRGGALGSKGMVSVVNPTEKQQKAAGWRTYSLGISPT
ncbi:uncharacterized protein [Ptychodera flava]|uniref:uncharacterized protein n=1 Tax=Ptychodera flava TaxID=63121 RepID=UPI00396A1234